MYLHVYASACIFLYIINYTCIYLCIYMIVFHINIDIHVFFFMYESIHMYLLCFSPNSMSTLRDAYGECKVRCLIRELCSWWVGFYLQIMAQSGSCDRAAVLGLGRFPANFRNKMPLVKRPVNFDCAGSHKVCAAVLGSNLFP